MVDLARHRLRTRATEAKSWITPRNRQLDQRTIQAKKQHSVLINDRFSAEGLRKNSDYKIAKFDYQI